MYFEYISLLFFFKQKTAYDMRISDWSSDVCSSVLGRVRLDQRDQYVGAHRGGLVAQFAEVDLRRGIVSERARGFGLRAHPPQHPADIRMLVDRHRGAVGRAGERRLDALGGKALRLLRREIGRAHV